MAVEPELLSLSVVVILVFLYLPLPWQCIVKVKWRVINKMYVINRLVDWLKWYYSMSWSTRTNEFIKFSGILINCGFYGNRRIAYSVFVFIDSLVVFALQDAGGYAISRQNNLELHLGCHTCWMSYFTFVYLWCGRIVGRMYGHVITKISRMGRLPHFLTHGAPLRALPRESYAIMLTISLNINS